MREFCVRLSLPSFTSSKETFRCLPNLFCITLIQMTRTG
jgi:hypothetical protein